MSTVENCWDVGMICGGMCFASSYYICAKRCIRNFEVYSVPEDVSSG